MSYFSQNPSNHDLYVSLACNRVMALFPGFKVVMIDGATPFTDLLVKSSEMIFGYRPDAVFENGPYSIVIEVKSFGDLYSTHTKAQMTILGKIIASTQDIYAYFLVFDVPKIAVLQINQMPLFGSERVMKELITTED